MSRAYRKWKELMRVCARTNCVYSTFAISDPREGISLSAYRRYRRARQRAIKAMRKAGFKKPFFEIPTRILKPGFLIGGYHQVSELERIRQANEYGRQCSDLS